MQYLFLDFSVSAAYKSVVRSESFTIPAIQRWENDLRLPISHFWPGMIRYIHDPILQNRTKEKIYKIYTRALPVGRKMHGNDSVDTCCFCLDLEDELHCFVQCTRLQPLWDWLIGSLVSVYPWIPSISPAERLLGYIPGHHLYDNILILKIFHAEFIRLIWYSRCRKLFDEELVESEAIKGMMRNRIQQAVSIHELFLKSKSKAKLLKFRRLWTTNFPNTCIANGRLKLRIP